MEKRSLPPPQASMPPPANGFTFRTTWSGGGRSLVHRADWLLQRCLVPEVGRVRGGVRRLQRGQVLHVFRLRKEGLRILVDKAVKE